MIENRLENLIYIVTKNTMTTKRYPKRKYDAGWMKFVFEDWDKEYTIRFSWKPLVVLEHVYTKLWWKDFMDTYNKYPMNKDEKMTTAIWYVNALLDMLSECELSPLVVYKAIK